MARTIAEIKADITGRFTAHPTIISLYGLNTERTFEQQFSPASLESILFYVIAASMWTLEVLFDKLTAEILRIIDLLRPHTARWYANKAKLFQLGHNLLPDTDQYDNTGLTTEQIEASRIIAHSAVVNVQKRLVIKVAKDAGDDLAPLTTQELNAFSDYMFRVKDAGVQTEIISKEADRLKLRIHILFNPLVLNSSGGRLDAASDAPVVDAVRTFLKNLPFNGLFVPAFLTDALQKVEGVVVPTIRMAQYKYNELEWTDIDITYQPYAGYMRVSDADLEIIYEPHSEII